jgi:hypothetical protein
MDFHAWKPQKRRSPWVLDLLILNLKVFSICSWVGLIVPSTFLHEDTPKGFLPTVAKNTPNGSFPVGIQNMILNYKNLANLYKKFCKICSSKYII